MRCIGILLVMVLGTLGLTATTQAEDIEGIQEHGLVSRYPG